MSRRNSVCVMDVDSPASLKRSSSAPMINDINTTMAVASTSVSSPRDNTAFNVFDNSSPRTRRFSASFSPQPSGAPRLTPRVNQLRQEECVDLAGREVAHEREITSTMQMSQSWEDLTLVTSTFSCKPDMKHTEHKKPTSNSRITDPLHVSLPPAPPLCSSPSPTRSGIRHFSPSLQLWNLSPSPTRKTFATRRSLSPIALRPSSLVVVKRKFELDEDNHLSPPAKRLSCGGLLMAQRLSPLPGSLSSVGTPESLSSADSPGFFRPVDSPSPVPSQAAAATVDEPMPEEPVVKHSLPPDPAHA